MGHMFACARYLSIAGHTMREGKWEKKAYGKGIELQGKTLGIVGFGRIGQHLGVMAKAIGMKVIAFDIYQVPVISEQLGIPYVEMDELLAQSDFISVHAPAVDGGALISAENIAKMKDGVVVINTSRGTNVDEAALLAALESGKVRAAGLTCTPTSPPATWLCTAIPWCPARLISAPPPWKLRSALARRSWRSLRLCNPPGGAVPVPCFLLSVSPRGIAAAVGAKKYAAGIFFTLRRPTSAPPPWRLRSALAREIVEIIAAM